MEKPTLIFDFDSTLIREESLEIILADKLKNEPEKIDEIARITHLGMEGKLDFKTSLQKRLEIASPTRLDLEEFGNYSTNYVTDGMKELLQWAKHHFTIWIVSGGLYESIQPFAEYFDIKYVHAVKLKWNEQGAFISIDESDPFTLSKLEGAKKIASHWSKPSIMIGDGFTDFQVFEQDLATHFIAFTQNVHRNFITSEMNCANSCDELKSILEGICSLKI